MEVPRIEDGGTLESPVKSTTRQVAFEGKVRPSASPEGGVPTFLDQRQEREEPRQGGPEEKVFPFAGKLSTCYFPLYTLRLKEVELGDDNGSASLAGLLAV